MVINLRAKTERLVLYRPDQIKHNRRILKDLNENRNVLLKRAAILTKAIDRLEEGGPLILNGKRLIDSMVIDLSCIGYDLKNNEDLRDLLIEYLKACRDNTETFYTVSGIEMEKIRKSVFLYKKYGRRDH